jgi:hypothetical protein
MRLVLFIPIHHGKAAIAMSHYLPTPPEIEETPELAVLSVLSFTLDVVSHALVAAHPEIAGEDDLPAAASAARCAECILGHAYKLKLLLASYGHFVAAGDEEPLCGNEEIE